MLMFVRSIFSHIISFISISFNSKFKKKMEKHYSKADSINLPKVDSHMVAHFFVTNPDFCSAEYRNVKSAQSSRESYGDDAIGYVQLRREGSLCTVKCTICPEHKTKKQPYPATMVIDEKESKILSVQCQCPAGKGGCKHAVAFLLWSHRRSEEPSSTSTECYWKKSTLAKVGSTLKYMTIKEMLNKPKLMNNPQGKAVLFEFLEEGKRRKLENSQILRHHSSYEVTGINMLSMHHLSIKYNDIEDCDQFLKKIDHLLTSDLLNMAEKETRDQHQNAAWHELRYARITASKAFDVSRCKTSDGSLTALIMGAKLPDTKAMKRGRQLEDKVRLVVEKQLGAIRKCGLLISKQYPMIAGSPDGILNENEIIEIKCPTTEKNYKNYITNGAIMQKYETQVQLQMYLANMKMCYFCVADANFENNSKVTIIPVHYNEILINRVISKTVSFWKNNIYPLLCNSTFVNKTN